MRGKTKKTLKASAILLLVAISFSLGRVTAPEQAQSSTHKPVRTSSHAEANIDSLVNQYRTDRGLHNLKTDARLINSAQIRADEIAQCGDDCFSHSRPNGTFFDTAVSDVYIAEGENLAICFNTNELVLTGWQHSELHNDNMLDRLKGNRWEYIGTAEAWSDKANCNVVVAHFAR